MTVLILLLVFEFFFCADLISVEKALNLVNDFGRIAGLRLNMKKNKSDLAWKVG